MLLTQSTQLDLIPGSIIKRVNVSQYDDESRTLEFVLFQRGVYTSIPSGATVTMQGTKPDGKSFTETCTYEDGTVSVNVTKSMTAIAGDVLCEIKIEKNDEVLGTANFILSVEKAPVPIDADFSPSEWPESLPERIEEIEDRLDDDETSLANIRQATVQNTSAIAVLDRSTVKTVNNQPPDANGNVNVTVSGGISSVNGKTPDQTGNVEVDAEDIAYTAHSPAFYTAQPTDVDDALGAMEQAFMTPHIILYNDQTHPLPATSGATIDVDLQMFSTPMIHTYDIIIDIATEVIARAVGVSNGIVRVVGTGLRLGSATRGATAGWAIPTPNER